MNSSSNIQSNTISLQYRYANLLDVLVMLQAAVFALVAGLCRSLLILLFGYIVNEFSEYTVAIELVNLNYTSDYFCNINWDKFNWLHHLKWSCRYVTQWNSYLYLLFIWFNTSFISDEDFISFPMVFQWLPSGEKDEIGLPQININ